MPRKPAPPVTRTWDGVCCVMRSSAAVGLKISIIRLTEEDDTAFAIAMPTHNQAQPWAAGDDVARRATFPAAARCSDPMTVSPRPGRQRRCGKRKRRGDSRSVPGWDRMDRLCGDVDGDGHSHRVVCADVAGDLVDARLARRPGEGAVAAR